MHWWSSRCRSPSSAAARAAFALLLASCSQLKFLKPPSVPVERGEASTERGPAFGAPLPNRIDTLADWLTYNRNLEGSRGSPLAEIDTGNVERLRPVCTFELDERAAFQSGPIVVGGTMFFTTAEYTYAMDSASCALRWKHRYRYTPRPDFDLKVNRGVAYADGRLFRGSNDARLYALDARTGEELWNVVAGDVKRGETFPAAPVAWRGLVFIGNAGGDNFGVTGRMMAFDADSGGRVWSFDLVPEAGEAARTWPPGTEVIPRAGGATWTSYTLDTLAGSVFLATGNAAPDFLEEARPGTNLHTYSVLELDARLGTFKWSRQLLKRDIHDWDLAAAPALVTTVRGRRLIAQGGKDGYLYAIDREQGNILYRTRVTRIENVDAPLTRKGTRFCPGVNGGIEWNGPTYSRTLNAFYVNAIDWCTTVKVAPLKDLEGKKGLPWTGSSELRHPFGVQDSVGAGWLTAIDAETGAVRWNYRSPTPLVAGITSTAGGLVFTGDLRGDVLAFDGRSGAVRWRYSTGLPIGGGVVTYQAGGRQHVAVAAGMHAPVTWKLESRPSQVVVFSLP
ncbi:MAG TPA: PQQ-binding-like beta-propeller repeat protein [Gemmatimonadales bacterium]|nr:PQQ-binding-like beta-propeller repeat protein [Gemmatimonadales bacterium]